MDDKKWSKVTAQWTRPVTEMLLDMAGVKAGQQVLDVQPSSVPHGLAVAKRVGTSGRVVTAPSAEGLDLASSSFDVALLRDGFAGLSNPERTLALLFQALKPGGRLALTVFSAAEVNAFFAAPWTVLKQLAASTPEPDPFAWGSEDRIRGSLGKAGARMVEIGAVAAPLITRSTAEAVQWWRDLYGAESPRVQTLGAPEQERAWKEIEEKLARYGSARGFTGPCEILVAVGLK